MYRRIVVVAAALVVSGCSLMSEAECRADSAGWQARGVYDALPQGDQPWVEAYASACRKKGVEIDEQAYLEGWHLGRAEFEHRVNVAD